MRHVFSLILAVCALQTLDAHRQTPSHPAVTTKNDRLAGALWRMAAATKTRIGFEATDHVRIAGRLEDIPMLSFVTLEDGLNAAVGADGRYEWRRIGDGIVVRPKRAWDDPTNPFNRSVRGVQVQNEAPGSVLLGIRDFIYTGKFAIVDPNVGGVPPILVSFEVKAGTVVDALNELTIAADQVLWIASYRPLGQAGDRWPSWDLSLQLGDARLLNAFSGSHAATSRQPPH